MQLDEIILALVVKLGEGVLRIPIQMQLEYDKGEEGEHNVGDVSRRVGHFQIPMIVNIKYPMPYFSGIF